MTIDPPPTYDQLTDEEGKTKLSWLLFFDALFRGDQGDVWTPTFQNLTEVGTPTITGKYYKIGSLTFFSVLIVPGTNTSATAGTTYIDNYPLPFTADGACWAMSGNVGDGPGHIVASNNRIYTPGWTTVTIPLTIIGIGETA